jgi:glycosyltransferase involved in cell wall biosynthesis
MRILYDHQAFTGMRYGGVARYFYELMRHYADLEGVEFDLSLEFSNNEYLDGAAFSNHRNFSHFLSYVTTNKVMSLVNRLNSIRILRSENFDIFHPTYYHKYFLQHVGNKPYVLTFHDCTNEKFHHLYPSLGGDLHALKQQLVDKASKVIAVSNNTKAELLHYFDVEESKIEVIYHGSIFSEMGTPDNLTMKLPKNYLIHVGNRGDFKNFLFFIEGITPFLLKNKDMYVVCAGGGKFTKEEKQRFVELGISQQIVFHYIQSDEMLQVLYSRALAFVFPSLNEGFGIPVLEAFACQCPVILSNTSCFPEIADNAAQYFDPSNHESILHTIERVVFDDELRKDMISLGNKRASQFSLQKTALQTLDVYKTVLGKPIYNLSEK